MKILQIAHGKVIPEHSSAYALRCARYLSEMADREVISVGGLVLKDRSLSVLRQYRSIMMTGVAFLKKGRNFEIYLSKGKLLRRKYLKDLKKSIHSSSIIVFEGPWQYRLQSDYLKDKVVVYDAHNVESILRKNDQWESYTFDLEEELVKRADHVITVSQEDADQIHRIYGKELEEITPISEGYVIPKKTWNGIGDNNIIFIGSAYLPNILAAQHILKMAESLPEFTFRIIGSVCNSLKRSTFTDNVKLLGILNEDKKEAELCNSLFALNPVESGSGRNVKMIDYISHGIPIITTEIGSRGFELELKKNFFVEELNAFPDTIRKYASDRKKLENMSKEMIEFALTQNYDTTKKAASKLMMSLYIDMVECKDLNKQK